MIQELSGQQRVFESPVPLNPERDELVLEHMPQIKYIAQRISAKLPSHVELNDLVSAGILGLLDAIEKFDPNRGVKFKTYAELRIKGAILDSLRNLDWAPRSLRKKSKDLERVYRELEQRLGNCQTFQQRVSVANQFCAKRLKKVPAVDRMRFAADQILPALAARQGKVSGALILSQATFTCRISASW